MADLATLRKNRSNSFAKLNEQLSKMGSNTREADDKYWKLAVDKLGNGEATIRFLPAPGDEPHAWVKLIDHGFEGPGGWYIEKSRKTMSWDEADPASEMLEELYRNAGKDDTHPDRKLANDRKRRTSFHANILVIRDKANPENEGKVFLYKFGKKIMDKIKDVMAPEFEDEEAINPFDIDEGADFKLRQRKVEGWPNYDKSEFSKPGPITLNGEVATDDQLEDILKQEHSLAKLVAPEAFKSYDDLKARLDKVLGVTGSSTQRQTKANMDRGRARAEEDDDLPPPPRRQAEARPAREETTRETPASTASIGDDDDETLDFFRSLAKD